MQSQPSTQSSLLAGRHKSPVSHGGKVIGFHYMDFPVFINGDVASGQVRLVYADDFRSREGRKTGLIEAHLHVATLDRLIDNPARKDVEVLLGH